MPYSQFNSLRSIKKSFGVNIGYEKLFDQINDIILSDWLKETLRRGLIGRMAFFSEKSRSEVIVSPILMEMQGRFNYNFSIYSGGNIDADKELGLNGECDFVLSKGEQGIEVERPVFCIVEAKDNDLELGVPQCIAQMLGVKIFNEQDGVELPYIYGASTTGIEWLFIKLEGNNVTIDNKQYYLTKPEELLGVLETIIKQF
jgi:hypothetical protein